MKITYKLWSKKENRFLSEDECWNLGISYDGKVIEFNAGENRGGAWLDREDTTDEYEIHDVQVGGK